MVSSRDIAERFEKQNKHVNESIKKLIVENSTVRNMFHETNYISSRGRKEIEYLMNRDGFALLAMGFTGSKALEWKLKYIDAFNRMEEELKSQSSSILPMNYRDAVAQLLEQIDRADKLEEENKVLLPKADYHDEVLNKDGLITTTVIAKDLGFSSAVKLNQVMFLNKIIFKNKSGTWCPYADYEWLIKDGYADYKSYENEHSKPCLKWTEKGRKWIIENYESWVEKLK